MWRLLQRLCGPPYDAASAVSTTVGSSRCDAALLSNDVDSCDGSHAGDTAATPTLKRRRSVPPLADAAGVRIGRGGARSGSSRRLRPRVLELTSPPASAEGAGGGANFLARLHPDFARRGARYRVIGPWSG